MLTNNCPQTKLGYDNRGIDQRITPDAHIQIICTCNVRESYCLSKNVTRERGMPTIYLVSRGSEDHDQMMQQHQ